MLYFLRSLTKMLLPAILLLNASIVFADPLGDLIRNDNFWKEGNKGDFMERYKSLGFRWTSDAMDSARCIRPGMTVNEEPVGETIVYFSDGKPSQIQISIHNRGDNLPMTGSSGREDFNRVLKKWAAMLTELSGVEMVKRGKDNKSAVKANGVIWTLVNQAYLLELSLIHI